MPRLSYTLSIAIGIAIGAFASYDLANADSPTARRGEPPTIDLVRERLPAGLEVLSITQLVDTAGALVRFGGHALEVPAGAVDRPTLFTLRMVPDGFVEIEATALSIGMFGRIVNVGERGFERPIRVHISYARASHEADAETRYVVAQRLTGPAGRFQRLPSTLDPVRRVVTAEVTQLAGYVLALD